jgi:penicillin-binding protein 1C
MNGDVLNVSLSKSEEWCIPVSLDKMGRWTESATLGIEDGRFFRHHGVDPIAIARALFTDIRRGRVISGASTITSQLIRISVPRKRTLYTKLLEFWAAMRIENYMNKKEILELYLNRAPFGGNIRGVEAASIAYFNKKANMLSLGESVTLISMLSSPSKLRPDRFPERARESRDNKLALLYEKRIISQENLDNAMNEYLPGRRYSFHNEASMAVTHAIKLAPGESIVKSTIDKNLQLVLEKKLGDALIYYPGKITSSGIVIENSTGAVKAYVGNARHGTSLPNAQVDCGDALRSPGSTLKPFIYAAAFERGILTPSSLLADTPLAFRGSAPRNFDMSYRGPVSARVALSSSLNAPAVRVLRKVGYTSAKNLLNQFGFSHINQAASFYTDSLILGGCETTLIELASAYRALAMEGVYTPAKWTQNSPSSARHVISPEASYLVTSILQDERRLLPLYQELFQEKNQSLAFKTGTSYGLRDAWCIGYTSKHTIGIWVGSPPGEGNPSLVGLQAAAPILLEVARDLWDEHDNHLSRPKDVYARKVCALSGEIPTKNCPQVTADLAIRNVTQMTLCALHKNIDGRSYIAWPPELKNWMQAPEDLTQSANTVKIIRPARGQTMILEEQDETGRIFLSAEGDAPHYWYLDGKFIGISLNGEGIFMDVSRGTHKASVMSGDSSDTVSFEARTPKEIGSSLNKWKENVLN